MLDCGNPVISLRSEQPDNVTNSAHRFRTQLSFDGIPALVSDVDAEEWLDRLRVTVPAGIGTGPVNVTVAGQKALDIN